MRLFSWAVLLAAAAPAPSCSSASDQLSESEAYVRRAKSSEARVIVKRLYEGARTYYLEEHFGGGTAAPAPPAFPSGAPLTPPPGACCRQPGHRCAPDPALWDAPTWQTLRFSLDDPHYYSAGFSSTATDFTARAVGDLDCDGTYATFELSARVGPDGDIGPPTLRTDHELE